jgi:ParB family transcriptional regulator, chromosome partitioning protein
VSSETQAGAGTDPAALARRLARSDRLTRRRFELLPLTGPGAAFTEVQGRLPGASTAPEGLAELISSIATVGVLQPVLVEELPDGRRRLVSGERRLRAAKWLATDQAADERFQTIPAICCPGPLSEEERRVWQLVENLAREDLRPGELAAALLYERCAVLAAKLLAAGVSIPADVTALEDPVTRFRALDRLRLRSGHSRLGAPWEEVLKRLGIQLSERKAQQLARAFTALPQDLSAEMDAAKVALHTRLRYLKLDQGNRAAARDIWEAVRARQQPQLLAAAVQARLEQPEISAKVAVDTADHVHRSANEARARQAHRSRRDQPSDTKAVASETVASILDSLGSLLAALRAGATLSERDAGSLRLYFHETLSLLSGSEGCPQRRHHSGSTLDGHGTDSPPRP